MFANAALPQGAVDRDAYVVCVLEALHRALAVRDVFATPSLRWADPRAHLLDGHVWEAISEDVLASLSLTDPVEAHLDGKLLALDAAWKQMAARLEEAGEDARVRVVTPADGRARLSVDKLGALGESPSLVWLRNTCQAMLTCPSCSWKCTPGPGSGRSCASAAVDQLRAQGIQVKDEDVARLSPLGHAHINFLGRYAITASAPAQGLRQFGEVPDLPGTAG